MSNPPDESLPPLLETLLTVPANELYSLVSVRELHEANALYRNGDVQEFLWSEDGEALLCLAVGQHEHEVNLALEEDGIFMSCNCSSFGHRSPTCMHVVATLFTICHVLDPRRFRPAPFSEARRKDLRDELLSAPGLNESVAPPTQVKVTLRQGWSDGYEVDVSNPNPFLRVQTPKWVEALLYGSRKDRDQRLFEATFQQPEDSKLAICVGDDELDVTDGMEEILEWKIDIDAGEDDISVQLGVKTPGGNDRNEPIVACSEGLAFLPSGNCLAKVKNGALFRAYKTFKEKMTVRSPLYYNPRRPFHVEGDLRFQIQDGSAELYGQLGALASKRGSQLLVEGRPASATRLDASIHVKLVDEGAGNLHALRVVAEADGLDLGWRDQLLKTEASKFSPSFPAALANAKTRRRALQNAEDHVYFSQTRDDMRKIAKATSELPIFERVRCQRAAGTYLNRLARTVRKKSVHLQVRRVQDKAEWVRVVHHLQPLAEIRALARQAFAIVPDTPQEEAMLIENHSLSRGLGVFVAGCGERDVRLSYNAMPLQTRQLRFAVQVERSPDDLDWFELHPEVTADGLTIDQTKWEKLIRGELIMQNDGAWVIDEDSSRTLRRLHSLVGRGPDSPARSLAEATRVPRLHIFDWLELEKAGVQLSLPRADQNLLKSLRCFRRVPEVEIPEGLQARLRPYQEQGLHWLAFLYRHRFGACLADDMGLGKTLQAIALLAAIKERKIPGMRNAVVKRPHLIVVPPSLLYNWQHEIDRFFPTLNVVEYTGARRTLAAGAGDVVLTTYELARRDIGKLAQHPFDVAIFDEAQQVKNSASRRNQAVGQLQARFRLCLTGTPLENHVGEYFTIMDLALPGLLNDARPFTRSIDGPDEDRYVQRTHAFVLRRTKAEILKDLPLKQESDVYLDMSRHQKELYTRTVGEVREQVLQAYADKTAAQAGIVALSALTRLRQICVSPTLLDPKLTKPSPKLLHLQATLLEIAEEGHAALVFSQFTRALDLMEPMLRAAEIPFTRLDGKTPTAKRKQAVVTFQHADGPPVFLISLKAGGVGLNLTRASYVFHVDPWWNPAVETQATDRAHRIGQNQTVLVNRILMHHTIEEKLMELKERKREVFRRIVDSRSTRGGGSTLSRQDLDFLLT